MKSKLQEFMRGFYLKRMAAIIVSVVVVSTSMASFTAFAFHLEVDDVNGTIVNMDEADLTSFFFRTGAAGFDNANKYKYGYGYGYTDGTYSYGYGFGYGYSYIATDYNDVAWTDGDIRSGFFVGTSDVVSDEIQLSSTGSGVATVPIKMELGGVLMGIEDAVAYFPSGLVIDGGVGWNGVIDLSADTTAVSGMSNGATVAFSTGGYDLEFSDEVIVVVPNSEVGENNLKVQIALSSNPNTILDVSTCASLGGSAYTGSVTTVADLIDADNYSLTSYASAPSTSHCYTFYADNIYIASRHASDFAAGVGTSSYSPSGSSGSGTSSGSSADDDEDAEEAVEEIVDEVSDFTDMEGIAEDDWRYEAVVAVFESGLFKGSKNAFGDTVIDLDGGMNRAMAATVLARYLECDTATAPTEKPFPDVDTDMWYAPSVACLADMGVVSGKVHVDPPIYDPGGSVTRGEYLKLFIESYLVKHPTMETAWRLILEAAPTEFEDLSSDDWYAGYFELAYDNDLIAGYMEDGLRYAKGNKAIIRVEAMKIAGDFLGLGDEEEVVAEEVVADETSVE